MEKINISPIELVIFIFVATSIGFLMGDSHRPLNGWSKQVTEVEQARSLIRVCVKDLNGVATVNTVWEEGDEYGKPVHWNIACKLEQHDE